MKDFYTKLLSEANTQYHFPIVLDKIQNSPQIFAVSPQVINDGRDMQSGIYPIIRYKSAIKLTDTIALKQENNAIQKIIGGVFKGIDEGNNYIIYQAFNKMPDGKTTVEHYGFLQHLK